MRILVWHVHGSWLTAFVQGRHDYLVPVLPDRGPDGRGRAQTWRWPSSVQELTPEQLRNADVDLVVAQRPHELDLAARWLGRRVPGDVPAVFLEHNAPVPHPVLTRHPLAGRDDVPLVHVTPYNAVFWDNGRAGTRVIEHGVIDPGDRYTGELPRAAAVINEPVRRGRMVGTDLLAQWSATAPIDLFGMTDGPVPGVTSMGNLPQGELHAQLARRRLYVHPSRWTSLGLSLIEAMLLGMPVVALAATEAPAAVPDAAGIVSSDQRVLTDTIRWLTDDPEAARLAGKAARAGALERYGVARFLAEWDDLMTEVVAR